MKYNAVYDEHVMRQHTPVQGWANKKQRKCFSLCLSSELPILSFPSYDTPSELHFTQNGRIVQEPEAFSTEIVKRPTITGLPLSEYSLSRILFSSRAVMMDIVETAVRTRVKQMSKQTDKSMDEKREAVTIDELQAEVGRLQEAISKIKTQMSKLSETKTEAEVTEARLLEQPHEAAGKCRRCRSCSHMRLPHRSNPHYACTARHSNIEPTWTCGLFRDKQGA
jgi:hypothetical protein